MKSDNEGKRSLDSIIDLNQYIVSKGVRKIYKEKLTLKEDGKIKLNNTFIKKYTERDFAVAFSKDFKEVYLVPNCEPEIHFSKNGEAKDVELVKQMRKKTHLPFVYILSWDDKRELWNGTLDLTTKE